jgi:hypothetical protein
VQILGANDLDMLRTLGFRCPGILYAVLGNWPLATFNLPLGTEPMPPIHPSSLFSILDFAGVLAGAIGGALAAKQNRTYEYDFVGVIAWG